MDIGPLIRSSEELRSSRSVKEVLDGVEDHRAELLELRTESGPLYVCPSRWQRIRLRWAFRHFRVLPPQVLSRGNQRLIEGLTHSALVTPDLPVARGRVFGVIENVRSESTATRTQVARLKTERRKPQPFPASLQPSETWRPDLPGRSRPFSVGSAPIPIRPPVALGYVVNRKARFVSDARFQQWGALGVLAAVCMAVILLRLYDPSLLPAPGWNSATSSAAPVKQAAIDLHPGAIPPLMAVSPRVLLPTVERPKQQITLPALEPTLMAEKASPRLVAPRPSIANTSSMRAANELETIATSSEPDRLFVSELPQGHFAEPVVTDPNLVGELRLRALIGSDGSVKEVMVVSGSPKLAEVGMRAVRRWRYQALGHPGEAETLIRMRFFGQDGVSIASMAK